MATREQKFKAGAFLLAGAILLLAIFIVVYMQGRQTLEEYSIVFNESVAGLRKDADVVFEGVPVGKVLNIFVNLDNKIVADIGIDPNKITLHRGVKASLTIGNIMGGAIIELSGGDVKSPPLRPGKASVIETTPSIMANLNEDLPKILTDIRNILGKIDAALGDVEKAELPTLVKNMDNLLTSAAGTLNEIQHLLASSQGTMASIEREVILTLESLRGAIQPLENSVEQLAEDPSSIIRGRVVPEQPYVR